MRRVVVTGIGMVSPLACGVDQTWNRLVNGESGAGQISRFDAAGAGLSTTIACEVPQGDGSDDSFNPDDWVTPKDRRRFDDFIMYGLAGAQQAIEDAGWTDPGEEECLRTGVMIGSGIGGLGWIQDNVGCVVEIDLPIRA